MDDGPNELTEEDYGMCSDLDNNIGADLVIEQLENGLDAVRATLGPAEQSGFTDEYIKDTLYHYYYDVDQTINYLLGV